MSELTAVHLCCGAGGITAGFEAEGIRTAYAFDVAPVVVETHGLNFPDAAVEVRDIVDVHAQDLPHADIVTCGIPCEPYSMAGYRLGLSDGRDISMELVRLFGELLASPFAPRYVFLENVPPYMDGPAAEAIRDALLGYRVFEAVFTHADYGAPQKRKRWHLLASARRPVPIPVPTHSTAAGLMTKPWVTFGQIRERDIAEPRYLSARAWKGIIRRQTRAEQRQYEGDFGQCYAKCYIVDDEDLMPTVLASWFKGCSRNQATVIYDDGRFRAPTLLEVKRAQGFPDTFRFAGNVRQVYEQIGRAVPPPFAAAVARAIIVAQEMTEKWGVLTNG